MHTRKTITVLLLVITFFALPRFSFSQSKVYDDFSLKAMPNWVWGGMIEMKYSHDEDNRENGFGELYTTEAVKPGTYVGKIAKYQKFHFTAGNFLNVMLQGVSNDCNVKIGIIYDVNNDNSYDEEKDVLLVAKPISLNFDGWKEVKIKLDEENFKIVSSTPVDLAITEDDAFGIRLDYETGKNYKESKLETGIALVSEIENKENLITGNNTKKKTGESYFKAKNYPNPFNPNTTISFTLPEASYTNVTVYDRLGREVKVLLDESLSAGTHSVEFEADGLPSGIYFYRIKTSSETEVLKMILAK
ncbi:MAG: T9SS type A sorting domain-containing protein [Ignavibacteriae bacterium]|nr:T9SS type A sorting domain-containing protein [Ignavibacteriota bacterium]MCB0723378.1 T9SS type A sorting domain-containing protein [Ignavibacteriota bacterium]MCB9243224.1 T9SS type A sorting domain-containing protein [Ignavibacteriales bacterium]